ncbi:MAG: peptidoglycan-binding domain-containing protein [Patescibacteria group bacterium]
MNKIISSKSAKIAAGLVGVIAGFAMVVSTASAYTFSTNLKQGSTGADVKNLQMVLNMSADTQVSVSGAGSPGNETSTFGPATKKAVIKFQNKYASDTLAPAGLTAGTGFVGPLTRAKLNTMDSTTSTTGMVPGCTSLVGFSPTTGASCASGVVTTTIPTGCTSTVGFSSTTGVSCASGASTVSSGPISVSLANTNPAAAAVVAGQATADLAHFAFSGTGTITNVKLMRIGISSNSTLSNVYLYNGSVRVSDGASVNNTDSSITFNNLSIAVNGSLTLSVRADIAAVTSGQIVGVQLTGYTVSGSTTMTSASISGNFMNIASATLAGITASSTGSVTATVNAGTMGQTFWSGTVGVSTRAVSLKGAAFKFIGSATSDAATNLKLYVNGSPVGSTATVDPVTNRLSFDFGSSPVTLNTGSQTLELRGDVVKGSNRTIQFNLENASDLIVMDSQLGVNIAVTAPTTSGFAAQNGTTVSVSTGSVVTTIDPSFTSLTNVTGGATGAVIGKFKLQAYGEDVKVSTLGVTVTGAGATPAYSGVNNVSLFYNGSQIGSSQNSATSTVLSFTLGSSLIISAGTTGTLEVRADIQSPLNVNYTAGTVTVALNIGSANGQGQSSSATMNVPTATVTANSLTIATGALSIAMAPGYSGAQTVNPNTANVKLGSFVLQNTSTSEGVRITNLAVGLTATTTNLNNFRTTETSGSGAIGIAPQATNNFSVNFTLAPGQTKTIDIMGDLGAATSGVIITTLLPTAVGASSNVTVTPGSATTGQTLTIQTGSVAVPTLNAAPASLAAQFVVGGTQNLGISQYNFVATNGVATISELKFAVGGTASTSTTTPFTTITVGGQSAPVVSGVAYITGLNISVPNSPAGANVSVQASFGSVGTNGIPSNKTATTSLTFMKYTIGGITTSTSTLAVVGNTYTLVGTKPTVTVQDSSDALLNGLVKVAEVTVSADAAGDLKLTALPISVTSTGVVTAATGTNNIVVKDTAGNTIVTTNASLVVTAGGTGTATIAFTGGDTITAGSSKIYRIYVTAATVSGAVNTTSLSTKLGVSSSFTWTDQNGGEAGITGANIYNYPDTTSVITN